MEFEKFEEVYQVLEAQKEKDETAAELYADVKEFAYKYATMRYRFSEMSREEKAKIIFREVNEEYTISSYMADDIMRGILKALSIIEKKENREER